MPPSPALKSTTQTLLSDATDQRIHRNDHWGVGVVLAALRAYKLLISPLFTGSCRFHPSCSDYMAEAVTRHGVYRGLRLGLRRLSRCLPFGGHGYDPVPRT
jgi:hypothetical protein